MVALVPLRVTPQSPIGAQQARRLRARRRDHGIRNRRSLRLIAGTECSARRPCGRGRLARECRRQCTVSAGRTRSQLGSGISWPNANAPASRSRSRHKHSLSPAPALRLLGGQGGAAPQALRFRSFAFVGAFSPPEVRSRGAAKEFSPRRKPWVSQFEEPAPKGERKTFINKCTIPDQPVRNSPIPASSVRTLE